jgi:Holliday junction DNA helicase RuvA
MIASLRGKVISRDTNRVIVEVRGVGYDVAVTLTTMTGLPDDGEIFFHIYTALRENSLELFGFVDRQEKALFEMLLGVTGIGPKSAITILSGISADQFQRAVLQGDFGRLTAIPGIGRKSAERIILELKEKIEKLGIPSSEPDAGPADAGIEEDLVSSLENLGYKAREARASARRVLARGEPGLSLSEAVRHALKELNK